MATLLIALVFTAVGILIGWLVKRDPSTLSRSERVELKVLREIREELLVKASEHAVLGDNFAVIASGIIHKNRK